MTPRIDQQQPAIAGCAVREVEHIETLAWFEQLAEQGRDPSRTRRHRDDVEQDAVTIDDADVGDRLEGERSRVEIPGRVDGDPFGVMAARRQGRAEGLDGSYRSWRRRGRGNGKSDGDRRSAQQGQSAHSPPYRIRRQRRSPTSA